MSTHQSEPKVELEVKNVGPIGEAKIDLRPLTVFVGPSNTGKTYLASLIYAAVNAIFLRQLEPDRGYLSTADADVFDEWLNRRSSSGGVESEQEHSEDPVPLEVVSIAEERLSTERKLGELLWMNFARCLGAGGNVDQLVRKQREGASAMSARIRVEGVHPGWTAQIASTWNDSEQEHSSVTTSGVFESRMVSLKPPSMPQTSWRMGADSEEALSVRRSEALSALVWGSVAHGLGPFGNDAYYLPAGRYGVMETHNVVVGAMLDSAPYAGLRERPWNVTLTGVLADFLREVMQMGVSGLSEGDKRIRALADEIERGVLQGIVKVELAESEIPIFLYQPKGVEIDIPLSRASSMVSEIAPVVLYLRKMVNSGETLIIEEPEAHLHPAAQAEFATHLAKVVNAGVRIIVTTHSNWIVDQIANLVKLDELPQEERHQFPGGDAALAQEDVGVWSFRVASESTGSTVSEIPYDAEGVGFDAGYLDIADVQYGVWSEASNLIVDRDA